MQPANTPSAKQHQLRSVECKFHRSEFRWASKTVKKCYTVHEAYLAILISSHVIWILIRLCFSNIHIPYREFSDPRDYVHLTILEDGWIYIYIYKYIWLLQCLQITNICLQISIRSCVTRVHREASPMCTCSHQFPDITARKRTYCDRPVRVESLPAALCTWAQSAPGGLNRHLTQLRVMKRKKQGSMNIACVCVQSAERTSLNITQLPHDDNEKKLVAG